MGINSECISVSFFSESRKSQLTIALKNGGDIIILVVSAVFGLSKLLLFRYIFNGPEFGNYALAIVYSQFLMYFLSPGADCGLIRQTTKLFLGKKNEFKTEFSHLFSILFILATFTVVALIISLFALGLANDAFYFFVILMAYGQILINGISIRFRVLGHFKVMGAVHILRIGIMSVPLYLAYFNFPIDANSILIFESLLGLVFCLVTALALRLISFSFTLKHCQDFYKLSRVGLSLSISALIKSATFSGERSLAKLLLTPNDFGIYSTFMIGFQVIFMGGSIIGQPIQRKVLLMAEQGNFNLAKESLLKFHILIFAILAFVIFVAFMSGINAFELNVVTLLLIVASAFLVGFSFYDNLVLAVAEGVLYIKILIITLTIATLLVSSLIYYLNPYWTILAQGAVLMTYMVALVVSQYLSCVDNRVSLKL